LQRILKHRLPDANDLKLYLSLSNDMSRGTAKTMIEAIAAGTRLRRKGRIAARDWAEEGSCDFGQGEKPATQVSWGDVATAFHSTGIPNIEVISTRRRRSGRSLGRLGSSSRSLGWDTCKAS
jgi:short subunit dehydrogenase-like uncharacterized protein